MKKTTLAVVSLFCLFSHGVKAQQQLLFKEGSTPVMDGIISTGEYADANSVDLDAGSSIVIRVWYKTSANAFYFAFAGPMGHYPGTYVFPEVCFDMNNDKSQGWLADDWWFHVSATDCDNRGNLNVYTNCKKVQSDWTGIPNFDTSLPDTVEVMIPFAKVGFSGDRRDTLGMAFMVNNTSSFWRLYPAGADRSKPSTWANVVFLSSTGMDDSPVAEKREVTVYPQPVHSYAVVKFEVKEAQYIRIRVADILGRMNAVMLEKRFPAGIHEVPLHTGALHPGINIVQLEMKRQTAVRRIVKTSR